MASRLRSSRRNARKTPPAQGPAPRSNTPLADSGGADFAQEALKAALQSSAFATGPFAGLALAALAALRSGGEVDVGPDLLANARLRDTIAPGEQDHAPVAETAVAETTTTTTTDAPVSTPVDTTGTRWSPTQFVENYSDDPGTAELTDQERNYFEAYASRAQAYLERPGMVWTGGPLTGQMFANAAMRAYLAYGRDMSKVVPVEMALAQGQFESHLGNRGLSAGNNPFNIGEFDGGNTQGWVAELDNPEKGISAYFDLMAQDYLSARTPEQLLTEYVNENGSRYASDSDYEAKLSNQSTFIRRYLDQRLGAAPAAPTATATGTQAATTPAEDRSGAATQTPVTTQGDTEAATAPAADAEVAALVGQMGTGVLREGARGAAVTALQSALNARGASIEVDGDFGRATAAAVRAFQSANGLEVDGVAGSQTRSALMGSGNTTTPTTGGGSTAADSEGVEVAADDTAGTDVATEREGITPTGDTATERRLDAFFQNFNGIPVRVNPGENPARYVDVIPPYQINRGHRLESAQANRRNNSRVSTILNSYGPYARMGKASTSMIKGFLEDCIAAGLVADTSAGGLRNFLARYGVSADCSGLVTQALNYLHDGNMDIESTDPLDPMNVGSGSLRGGRGQFTRVATPAQLLAGDTMHVPGHIRILIDVDISGDLVQFRSIESTPKEDVVEPGQRDSNASQPADGGIGDIHWRYANGAAFSGLQRSNDGGNTWRNTRESPTYGRWNNMVAEADLLEQERAADPRASGPR